MLLYMTTTSPYARLARIMVREKGLSDRVEEDVARTREAGSPYYAVNPSGRIPYLICDDGTGLEDSAVICRYLDHLAGPPAFEPPHLDPGAIDPAGEPDLASEAWVFRRLEAVARSTLDGLAVWGRELRRPQEDRSAILIAHEAERFRRMMDWWQGEIGHPLLQGPFNRIQMTLFAALQFEIRDPCFAWRDSRSELAAWSDRLAPRPSLAATVPPARI